MKKLFSILVFLALATGVFAQRFPMAVETVPQLLSLQPNSYNTNAWVLGLTNVNDGFGGWFTWWINDSTATDTFNVFPSAYPGAVPGRWKRTTFFGSLSGGTNSGPFILQDGSGAASSNAVVAQITITATSLTNLVNTSSNAANVNLLASSNVLYSITLSSTNLSTLSGMLTNLYAGRTESQAYTLTSSNNLYTLTINATNIANLSPILTNLYAGRTEMQAFANAVGANDTNYTKAATNSVATNALANTGGTVSRYVNTAPPSTTSSVGAYAGQILGGTANYTISGSTHFECFNTNNAWRLRASGPITKVGVYFGTTNGITNCQIAGVRPNGTNWDRPWITQNLIIGSSSGVTNYVNVTTVTNSLEGDYTEIIYDGDNLPNLFATNSSATYGSTFFANAAGSWCLTNVASVATNMPWGTNVPVALSIPYQIFEASPDGVAVGDSQTAGVAVSRMFSNPATNPENDPASDWTVQVERQTGLRIVNSGISGAILTADINTRMTNDVWNLLPTFVILQGGINDLLNGTNVLQIVTQITNDVNAAVSRGIKPYRTEILPCGTASSGTLTISSNINYINSVINSMTNGFPTLTVIRWHDDLGQYYPAGPAGNLDQLNTNYDSGDGLHFNAIGAKVAANRVSTTITPLKVLGGADIGHLDLHGEMVVSGEGGYGIRQLPPTQYMSKGSNYFIRPQRASAGSTNLSGGGVELHAGTSTGNGHSDQYTFVAPSGSSGSTDNKEIVWGRYFQDALLHGAFIGVPNGSSLKSGFYFGSYTAGGSENPLTGLYSSGQKIGFGDTTNITQRVYFDAAAQLFYLLVPIQGQGAGFLTLAVTNDFIAYNNVYIAGNLTNASLLSYTGYFSNSVQTPVLLSSANIQNTGTYFGTNEVRLFSSDQTLRFRIQPNGTGPDGTTQPNIIAQGGGVLMLAGITTTSNQVSEGIYQNFPYTDLFGEISQGSGVAGRPGGMRLRLYNSSIAWTLETNGLWHFDTVGTNNAPIYFANGLTISAGGVTNLVTATNAAAINNAAVVTNWASTHFGSVAATPVLKEGSSNPTAGTVALVGGTATVSTTNAVSGCRVKYWVQAPGGTQGFLSCSVSAGTSFTINSTSGSDTSTVLYEIVTHD